MTVKKKQIPIFIMTLMLVLSLCACGGADGSEPQNITPSAPADNSGGGVDEAIPDNTDASSNGATTDNPDVSNEVGTPPDIPQLSEEPSEEPSESPVMASGDDHETSSVNSVVALAESLIGAEFEWGAAGPDTFDNSGFAYYCFKENGITIPRKTVEMFASGTAVEREDLLPGDLVFFTYNDDRSASYVGIYMGDGQFIAENNEDSPVCIHDMTLDYYTKIYIGARRYLA